MLRKGGKDRGVLIRIAYFKPSLVMSGADPVLDNYRKNRLTAALSTAAPAASPGA